MHELSKREKKIARICIDKGVQAEYKKTLEQAKQVIADWENGNLDNREAYSQLYGTVKEQDKFIARRYDKVGGSDYLVTVAAILHDNQITEEDIKDFTDETKEVLHKWMKMWKEL